MIIKPDFKDSKHIVPGVQGNIWLRIYLKHEQIPHLQIQQ